MCKPKTDCDGNRICLMLSVSFTEVGKTTSEPDEGTTSSTVSRMTSADLTAANQETLRSHIQIQYRPGISIRSLIRLWLCVVLSSTLNPLFKLDCCFLTYLLLSDGTTTVTISKQKQKMCLYVFSFIFSKLNRFSEKKFRKIV